MAVVRAHAATTSRMPLAFLNDMVPRERLRVETVPDFPDGDEVLRFGRIVLELLAQLGHVRVDRTREHDRAMVPDFAQQLDAGGDSAVADRLGEDRPDAYLQKPFRLEELRRALDDLLGPGAASQ